MSLDKSSRSRLTPHQAARFAGTTLFDEVARALCTASVLPRKELYESWEVAKRVRREMRGGRVVDLACGHGLLGALLLLLDDTSPTAVCVDARLPDSAAKVRDALTARWPRLAGRVLLEARSLEDVPLTPDDVVVSAHACGALTDTVLARAGAARARVAVLPCCHVLDDDVSRRFRSWADGALAQDLFRAFTLEQRGYTVKTRQIPAAITPKNRLLLAVPRD